jgi:SAM-dependent methyltransferase
MSACRICGGSAVRARHTALEMMRGTREAFEYFECADCLCLQITTIPDDLARHYGEGYYSYRLAERRRNPLKRLSGRLRDRWAVFGGGALGQALYRRAPAIELHALQRLGLGRETRVLDVGCGAGQLVFTLGELGMRQVGGIDPHVPNAVVYDNGVQVRKLALEQTAGQWDLIMFHHAFEHVPDPLATLQQVAQRLAPGGHCLLRVPTVTSHAWRHYGVNWVQLDAPRHLHLFAHESIDRLARHAGFEVVSVVHDSYALQFWGSEQYAQGIALQDERSHARSPGVLFTPEQIAEFERRSVELNHQGLGDQAAFYLRKLR